MNVLAPAARIALWSCAFLVVYAYAGYPILIWLLSRVAGRRGRPPEVAEGDWPEISILLAAYNEEAVIGPRLENALAMDYPPGRLEIVVGSDGSRDGTAAIVRRFEDRGVRLLDFPDRRGKAAVLNDAMGRVRGEIVLLSDANTEVDPQAARKLARWFRRPEVGAVCGRLVLTDPRLGRNADGLYWKYETFLKRCEGRLGALLGANGAIYAIRKDRYAPIPDGTIVDDFVIPLLAKVKSDCAIVYDGEAVAHEETPADVGAEFRRRSRIGAGGFQSIGLLWKLLDPRRGWVAFTFLSHKILRWLCPFFLLGLVASNLLLLDVPFYRATLAAQAAFYGASMLAGVLPARMKLLKPLRLATMFTSMNAALLVGFCKWLRGGQRGIWTPTARGAGVGVGGAAR